MLNELLVRLSHRRLGDFAFAGVAVFAFTCVAAQFLRSDLDWARAPLSFYLLGEYGWVVRGAYFILGIALVLLGWGYYRTLSVPARSSTPMLLFCVAGVALDVTALADSHTGDGPLSWEGVVHGLAATSAFLCVTSAMLLQAWRLRADAVWRRRFAAAFSLAVLCFVAMWVHALWRDAPRGLTQKIVILLIIAWLAMAAWWLRGVREPAVVPLPAAEPGDAPHEP